jgi:hypothetical protein
MALPEFMIGRRRPSEAPDKNQYFSNIGEAGSLMFGNKEQSHRFTDYDDPTAKQVVTFLQQLDGWDWFYEED